MTQSSRAVPETGLVEELRCDRCHAPAVYRSQNSHGSNLVCEECRALNEAEADEVDAHEMSVFNGEWGLVERCAYTPLAIEAKDREIARLNDALSAKDRELAEARAEIERREEERKKQLAINMENIDKAVAAGKRADAAERACKAAWDSIGRFPGSLHDRAMSRLERVLKGRNFDYTDPDLQAAERERDEAMAALREKEEALEKAQRTIGHRDRRIARLWTAIEGARAKGYRLPAEDEPPVVLSSVERPCPHAPTYDAGLCCGHPDDCTFIAPPRSVLSSVQPVSGSREQRGNEEG